MIANRSRRTDKKFAIQTPNSMPYLLERGSSSGPGNWRSFKSLCWYSASEHALAFAAAAWRSAVLSVGILLLERAMTGERQFLTGCLVYTPLSPG